MPDVISAGTTCHTPQDQAQRLLALKSPLSTIRVLPLQFRLKRLAPDADAALLRSVWGKCLHDSIPAAYDEVFRTEKRARDPEGRIPPNRPQPYVLCLGLPANDGTVPMELTLIGDAVKHESSVLRGWQLASRMGLGSKRLPFEVISCVPLDPHERPIQRTGPSAAWDLSQVAWPLKSDPETSPCRLEMVTPLRLLSREIADATPRELKGNKRLIESPTFAQLVASAMRRIGPFLAPVERLGWQMQERRCVELAERHPCGEFSGWIQSSERWSASQKASLNFAGVCGSLSLPFGPGPFWMLLAVARWLHLGKNTTHGLGVIRMS
jgi:hypothetical protein